MRLNFRKLTTAASVAVVSALAWSGSVQAAPQILGLVASNGPIPLKCDSYYCAAEFTTFCLQQERKGPPRNHVYHAHNGGEGIRILGPEATGEVVEMANGSALEIIAPRGQTVVNMSVPKRMLDKFGVTKVAIEIAPNVSLLPQENPTITTLSPSRISRVQPARCANWAPSLSTRTKPKWRQRMS
ncbi:MAG: hypothetical protein CL569_12200 [Alphaproteobacteria bacterium]|nr:hypothetical protein [Alphaproteobacteria bacterium]|tara:strand:+ start:388 stop:942 length:555 start_codon:yes stop_codon:yes gene_type:complete